MAGIVTTGGGAAGSHPEPQSRTVAASPTVDDKFNALRIAIFPIACWRVDDIRFEFDSSFVRPDISDEMVELKKLIDEHTARGKKPPLSIFGHADPVGDDDYNKKLSGRRAAAIYALIARRPDIWEDIFKNKGKFADPLFHDDWGGLKSTQTMLVHLGLLESDTEIDGVMGPKTKAAVEAFQSRPENADLTVDGKPGEKTREKLFKAYMDSICKGPDGNAFELAKTDFLGNGADETGKADYQGCSEFNPLFLFSKDEQRRFQQFANKAERDTENAPNRRVVAFLYRPDLRVSPEKWPCPRAKEGFSKCKDRFWSDGEDRRTRREPDTRREHKDTKDVFACRFYDRMSSRSPCEGFFAGLTQEWVIKLLIPGKPATRTADGTISPGTPPEALEPFKNQDFILTVAGVTVLTGKTDAFGVLRVPLTTNPVDFKLKVGKKDDNTGEIVGAELTIKAGILLPISGGDEAVKRRLHNLGYGKPKLADWDDATFKDALAVFRAEHNLPDTGSVDDPTTARLKEVHGS